MLVIHVPCKVKFLVSIVQLILVKTVSLLQVVQYKNERLWHHVGASDFCHGGCKNWLVAQNRVDAIRTKNNLQTLSN